MIAGDEPVRYGGFRAGVFASQAKLHDIVIALYSFVQRTALVARIRC
jgi:hypothetical protein